MLTVFLLAFCGQTSLKLLNPSLECLVQSPLFVQPIIDDLCFGQPFEGHPYVFIFRSRVFYDLLEEERSQN
jgi:hypothetical protein